MNYFTNFNNDSYLFLNYLNHGVKYQYVIINYFHNWLHNINISGFKISYLVFQKNNKNRIIK